MSADLLNGCFQLTGAVMAFNNCRVLFKHKKVSGVSALSTSFFVVWGFWNLYFFGSLGQWWSVAGGGAIVAGNALWVALYLFYRRN